MILISSLTDLFFTVNNLMNILRQVSMTALLGVGLSFVMLGGEIDISVGSAVGLMNVLWVKFMMDLPMHPLPAAVICFLIAAVIGATNGFLVAKVKVPALIVTFAMQSILRGIIFVITDSYPMYKVPEVIFPLARGYILGIIPIPVCIMIAVFIIAIFVSVKTKFGRFVYAVGGNKEAAHISGIKVANIKICVFIIGQCMAVLAALLLTSRIGAGLPNSGTGWEFEAIIACIMGGISLSGGKGRLLGALSGAIFVGIMVNGMTLFGINSYYQQIVKGLILVLALVIDVLVTQKSSAAV
jgi:ribose transport system permease protein